VIHIDIILNLKNASNFGSKEIQIVFIRLQQKLTSVTLVVTKLSLYVIIFFRIIKWSRSEVNVRTLPSNAIELFYHF